MVDTQNSWPAPQRLYHGRQNRSNIFPEVSHRVNPLGILIIHEFLRSQRQSKQNSSSLIHNALRPNRPTMSRDDSLDDGQTQAAPGSRSRTRAVRTIKALKDIRKIGRVDPAACITYPHGKEAVFLSCPDRNLAPGRRMVASVI